MISTFFCALHYSLSTSFCALHYSLSTSFCALHYSLSTSFCALHYSLSTSFCALHYSLSTSFCALHYSLSTSFCALAYSLDFPQNLIGFQIRLIDASRNEIIETFDIGMSTYYVPIINQDGFFILYLGTFGSAPRGQSLSCAPLEHSRVLTQNYFGRYIKSDEDWTLKVQVSI